MTTASRYMLTAVGHRRQLALQQLEGPRDESDRILAELSRVGIVEGSAHRDTESLVARGWLKVAPEEMTAEEALLRYQRNPLEGVERINFEVTTQCNFTCLHCRNGGVKTVRERDIGKLMAAGDLFLGLGIRRFDFIGGEVTRYGDGWLDLTRHLTRAAAHLPWPAPLVITVFTNGWWLGATDFEAAGRRYAHEAAYLADLRESGVSHVLFSIDGPPERHDAWRGQPGLYQRILEGIPRVKAAGLAPRLSIVKREEDGHTHLLPLAEAIYGEGDQSIFRMDEDPTNQASNFIDVGRAAEHLREGLHPLETILPHQIRCKAFFRPAPTLRIMADGALGLCPLMLGEEGYGNLHERPLIDLLNQLDEALLYQLHASGTIGSYLEELDPERFPKGFDHICAVRIELNRMALADPEARVRLPQHQHPEGPPPLTSNGGSTQRLADSPNGQPLTSFWGDPGSGLAPQSHPWPPRGCMKLPKTASIVILTGAGISAESGIRTFRDSNGLWENHRVEDVASPEGFQRNPRLVHQFYNARRAQLAEVEPNAAHHALARLEREWPGGVTLVTQNVDDLHGRAGSSNLIHMHGELKKAACRDCKAVHPWNGDLGRGDTCPACGVRGQLRPHIVWFGEVPLEMDRIYQALDACGCFVAIGTSGNVYPAAGFVEEANPFAYTLELNLEPSLGATHFFEQRSGKASELVTAWVDEILGGLEG